MAAAGLGSRRTCEEMIRRGLVQVNGKIVTQLGTKIDPDRDQVVVKGRQIKRQKHHSYIKVYKPRDVLSDIGGDTRGRKSVADLVTWETGRLFSVGRLDFNSEGLVLLTDDGELANRITHPRYAHPKTYYVLVEKRPTVSELQRLCKGVKLPDGYVTAPAQFTVVDRLPPELFLSPEGRRRGVWLKAVLREGKKRQIRHMTAAVNHPTLRLIRWSIGDVTLKGVKPGECTPLTRGELAHLHSLSRRSTESPRGKSGDQEENGGKERGAFKRRSPSRQQRERSTSLRGSKPR